jgi:hypothetical protein
MFEQIVLRRAEGGTPITAGALAEALLFYQRVHLVVDRPTLLHLVKQIGISQLVSLTRRTDFSAVYAEEMLATMTNSVGPLQVHDYGAITMSGDQKSGTLKSPEDRLRFELERCGVSRVDAKSFAGAFLSKVPVRKLSGDHFIKGGIPNAARADLQDRDFTVSAIRRLLPLVPGGYEPGDDLDLKVVASDLGHYVFSNIDLESINSRRAALTPPVEPLTMALLLSQIQEARADLAMAAHYGCDFATSTTTSAVVQLRHDVLLQRTRTNEAAQKAFAEVAIPDMPAVSEVVDAGERSFDEFLRLLDRSERFKRWVKSANPDEGLAREYMLAVSSQDWIQTTKVKVVRYMLTLAAEATHPFAGIAAGFSDNFLTEKLLGGWRPNHFVQARLVPFLAGQ